MLVVMAWRTLLRRFAPGVWTNGKNPTVTQIYASLSGLRQSFDQPIVMIGNEHSLSASVSQYGL
jgi:hypothetical protein